MNIRNSYFIFTIIAVLSFFIVGCEEELPAPPKGTENEFTDIRDSRNYKSIEIGNQIWMAENLAFKIDSGIGCWDMDTSINNTNGFLYTWETAMKAAPEGWHLPSKKEWEELISYLGGSDAAGGRMKQSDYWKHPNTDGNNSSGFTAKPAGYINYTGKDLFLGEGGWGYWWSSTLDSSSYAWAVRLHNSEASAITNDFNTRMAFSIRCVKN